MDPIGKSAKRDDSPELEPLITDIVDGRRGLRDLPPSLSAEDAATVRRVALERMSGTGLETVGRYGLSAEMASARHCENFIGAAQVPMGVVGPLQLHHETVGSDERLFVPLATTEGALLASVNRGCRAIVAAGGATVRVDDVGMTRAPAFRVSGIDEAQRFVAWVREHEEDIRGIVEATSRYLKLVDIRTQIFGTTTVYLRFRFTCGDAMGMNMATIACDRAVRDYIAPESGAECVALSGNFCVDKKASAINFIEGRGKRIYAEVVLEKAVIEEHLKSTSRELVELHYRKNLLGSAAAGSSGFNAHFANVLAAFFVATGQDLAHVVEGSMGLTSIEPRGPEGVLASVYLPDAPVGVVGGGTVLDTQRESIRLLRAEAREDEPGRGALRLAAILGATVLAGELSLLAAMTTWDLAGAHQRLGRGGASD